jgi:hypothetical protein
MLRLDQRFRLPEQVAAKVFDGEAILINMSTGMYYSMTAVGALVWEYLQTGQSLEETVRAMTMRYEVSSGEAEADLRRLAAELLDEGLIAPTDDGMPAGASAEMDSQPRQPYVAPRLEVYRDMGDLLALDPPAPELMDIAWNEEEDASSLPPRRPAVQ